MRKSFVIAIAVLVASAGLALAAQPTFTSRPASHRPDAPVLPPPGDPVNLILDDGVFENNIGLNGSGFAYQFAWLNRYSPPEFPIEVTRIDVWWDSVSAVVVGGEAIELVVYAGTDDPCVAGPTIAGGQDDTIAVLDAFDQHTLTTPVQIAAGPSVYLGVIDRWVVSGATTQNNPAAIDTTATQGRSFVASWSTDPPVPPTLPPDGLCGTIDSFGFAGNWLVRGVGTVVPVELQRFVVE